ncbi:MAG: DUF4174 domain-containing protein [Gemmobacter sp.]
MKLFLTLALIALPLAARAEDVAAAAQAEPSIAVVQVDEAGAAGPVAEWGPVDAAEVALEDFLWQRRPIVVFADSAADPQFERQMRLFEANTAALVERDVIVVVDTDPAARNPARTRLRPRGFSLVLMEKDGEVKLRKPSPWDVREIANTIDKWPLRRQEMLERRPAGR